jgi:hypothetical protein
MSKTILPDTDHRAMGRVKKDLERVTITTPTSYSINGPRSDLTGGWGPRVRIGILSDLSYGIERYSSGGVRTTPTWS